MRSTLAFVTLLAFVFSGPSYAVPTISTKIPMQQVKIKSWNIPEYVKLSDASFYKPGEIDMLIGASLFWDILTEGKIKLGKNLPVLQNTQFGWIVSGITDTLSTKKSIWNFSKVHSPEDEQLKRFWELEEVSNTIPSSEDDLKFFQENESQENAKFLLYEDENGDIDIEDLTVPRVNLTASAKDMTYHFFSRKNPTTSVHIHSDDISTLSRTAFNANRDSVFIIHGWKNTHESDVNSHIREYVLKGHDVNVFVVDWSPVAGKTYLSAQGSVAKVGGFVGDFIKSLQANFRMNLAKVKIVGHSLGAHVGGCAGASLNGQVDRIVGLDPAGPLFSIKNKNNRLDASDAKYVQIIHTNDGMLGMEGELGHSDYYPNGGRAQPGCGVDLTGSCSHGRAYTYYAESLNTNRFVARKCDSMTDYKNGKCEHGQRSSMGQFRVDTGANGKYYLTTNDKSPFAQG